MKFLKYIKKEEGDRLLLFAIVILIALNIIIGGIVDILSLFIK